MKRDVDELIQGSFIVVVGLITILFVASMFFGGSTSIEQPAADQNITLDDSLIGGIPTSVDVSATTGNGLSLDGSGYVDAPALSSGSVTVCASGQLADGANADATYTLYAARNGSFLLEYDAGNWMVYAENKTSGDDAKATLPAPSPGSWRQVCGRYNATEGTMSVSRDGTVSAPVALSSATTSRNVSLNWVGQIDEVRTFGTAESNATLTAYGSDPIQPLPSSSRTGRMMLDEGSGSDTRVYWAGVNVSIVDGGWGDGLNDVALQRGTDYQLYENPFSIKILSNGYLVGAPVVYATWTILPMGMDIVGILVAAVSIVILGFAARALSQVIDDLGE